jgi:predicted ATP-grasp superfamily ATP-dependent carboligase
VRFFVYEFCCAELSSESSLTREGWTMLSALIEDLSRCNRVEIHTQLSPFSHANRRLPTTVNVHPSSPGAFADLARSSDHSIVIAPEADDILVSRVRSVLEVGGRHLGPSPQAVELTSDKVTLACHWKTKGVPTPEVSATSFPAVLKPRFGAGSQATYLVHDEEARRDAEARARKEWPGEMILQPFHDGLPASVSCLIGPREQVLLPACEQILSGDGRFHYLGGRLPLPAPLNDRAQHLTRRALAAVPGLLGYVGVDMILGRDESGRDDVAVEINPRLTTSYVGLRALANGNLAEALLAVATGSTTPALSWKEEPIMFHADGGLAHVENRVFCPPRKL